MYEIARGFVKEICNDSAKKVGLFEPSGKGRL
jgi:hypothetical protein